MKQDSLSAWRFVWMAYAVLLSLCTTTTSTAQPLSIIAGPITNPANAHVYYLLAPTNWIGAWFNAGRAGGKLVTINDAAENAWVFDTFANYDGVPRNLWIGLRDTAQEGTWVWDSGDSSIYRNWTAGEPDNGGATGNEDYVVMRGLALSSPGTWSDASGDVTNAPVVEKIPLTNPPPVNVAPSITSQPQNWTVPVGADVTFFVSATGTAPLSYQWRHFEMNLTGATNAWLTLSNVQPVDAGTYSVLVSNIVGVAISSNATLTVLTPGANCATRPAGLVAWWRAEGNANDSAGTNHGTTPEGIGYVAGEVRQAFDFGFFDQYRLVLVPGSPDFVLTNSFAVEGWIYPRQAENGLIFNLGGTPGAIRLSMESSPGNVTFEIWNDAFQSVSLQAPIQTNQWHHIAAMLEGTSGTMTLYMDGVARAQTNTMIRPTLADQLPPIWIGAIRGSFGHVLSQFNGLIDELSVYSRALSSNEVHAIYSADGAGKCLDGLMPLILSHPTNQTVAAGSNAIFTVTASGAPTLNYQWRHEATNLPGATNTSLTLTNVQPTDAGIYSVLVSNAIGVAVSSNAALTVFTASTNCVARPAGLVAWWRAEGNENDSAGTHHGTFWWPYGTAGFAGYTAGQVGHAFDFNGWQVVGVPGSLYYLLTNSFAVEGWIYTRESNNEPDTGVIFGLGRAGSLIRLSVEPSAGRAAFEIGNAVSLQSPIQTNQWHHIAATFESTSGLMKLYVDGVTRAQTNTVISPLGNLDVFWPPIISIGSAVDVARWTYFLVFPFNGLIDELSVYSRALSSNEVHAIYSADGGKCVVSPASFGIASLTCEPGANTTLRIGGMAGNTYFIEASTNLLDWQVLGSSVADGNGVCEFEDPNPANFPCRYYRVVVP